MICIANSSPLIGLSRIGRLDILQRLFSRTLVPGAVAQEVGQLPERIEICEAPAFAGAITRRLGPGELGVLGLASMLDEEFVLALDDLLARREAQRRGSRIIGTLGIFLNAKSLGIVGEIRSPIAELQKAGFYMAPALVRAALAHAGERGDV